jgi:hypothetical protein
MQPSGYPATSLNLERSFPRKKRAVNSKSLRTGVSVPRATAGVDWEAAHGPLRLLLSRRFRSLRRLRSCPNRKSDAWISLSRLGLEFPARGKIHQVFQAAIADLANVRDGLSRSCNGCL